MNAAPVPSSRDTALTIAADKGHYKFVELILRCGAHVDVKNKKGNSPLWLACNGKNLGILRVYIATTHTSVGTVFDLTLTDGFLLHVLQVAILMWFVCWLIMEQRWTARTTGRSPASWRPSERCTFLPCV